MMQEKKYPVKRGNSYSFDIEKLAFGGAGVARKDNYVIFVKGALPGESVKARITKRKKAYAEARLLEIETPSPRRVQPPCPYFDWCGGCTWQNLAYEDQLKYKRRIVAESLLHIGQIRDMDVGPVLPAQKPFGYRNKMEFSFAARRWLLPEELGDSAISNYFALGLHVPGTFDKILQIDHCMLQSETANEILRYVNRYARDHQLQPYGIKSHDGFLRFLVLRESSYNGEIMVNLVTAYEAPEALQQLARRLVKEFPAVQSVVNNINTRPAQIAVGEKELVLAGRSWIEEQLGPFRFKISANSFFQTNTFQAERLYRTVMEFADLDKDAVVWDLYAGTGTISLFLGTQAKEVIGFEAVQSAVDNANQNIREHKFNNIRFVAGDLMQTLPNTAPEPSVLITDPPRAGMHEKVVRYINQVEPERLVYVSCNPTTLARDLRILTDKYEVKRVQPVDMFPQTYHIETVVKLERTL